MSTIELNKLRSLDKEFEVDVKDLVTLSEISGTDVGEGSALIGRSTVVVEGIKDLLSPELVGRTDIVIHVRRYWPGIAPTFGGGHFIWTNNPKNTHDGGVRISPTVPWDGTQATHQNFLKGIGETDPSGSGYWLRVAHMTNRYPTDYGASQSASVVPDNKYIFDHFEIQWPNVPADLGGQTFSVSSYPSGAKYFNGTFRRTTDNKSIDAGYSSVHRVGNQNTLVGRNTATNLVTNQYEQSGGNGYNLTAVGDGALFNAGNNLKHQIAIGVRAGYNQRYGRYNTYIGLEAGYSCTGSPTDQDVGSRNVAIGDNSMRFNQADHNIAIGRNAMQVSTTGRQNVYIGSASGGGIGPVSLDGETILNPFPTTGSLKTAVGVLSLNWAYADNAVGLGSQALESLKGGANNCAVGTRALRLLESNVSPKGTTISNVGAGAVTWTKSGTTLTVTNTGHANVVGNVVAITFTSGVPSNVTGVTQYLTVTAVTSSQWQATLSSAEAAAISASGDATVIEVYTNETVSTNNANNTAVGNLAGQALLSGGDNVFVGQAAAFNATSASACTVVGRSAMRFTTTGGNELGRVNCTVLGYNTSVSGDNQVQLGDSATTTYVYGTVQNRSDLRDKTDIRDTELGSEFILGLRPVSGRWDMRDDYIEVDEEGNVIKLEKDGSKARSRRHQWFVAQEVESLCQRLGVDFGGLQHHSVNGGDDVYSLGYDEFIPPIVKTVQECWSKLSDLEARIVALEGEK